MGSCEHLGAACIVLLKHHATPRTEAQARLTNKRNSNASRVPKGFSFFECTMLQKEDRLPVIITLSNDCESTLPRTPTRILKTYAAPFHGIIFQRNLERIG